ncbi:TetR/AcrR family transcriptional regulator [Halosquirtibacter laminarini]|uniref:TetR/AcrR family transcriptional regulator n=1 Tax=Halosquirtibacter laminarini TaxID=3374600 RepID=A0AC61NNE1_9BACT|nr:TetR/AcrR family transcriptional regulator [Prolixibacteraceae bacterium]
MDEPTRDKIIESSRLLFASDGVANVTISRIAKHAGVGRRTIYMYFASKDSLYDEVVAYEVDLIYTKIKEAYEETIHCSTDKVIREYYYSRFYAFKDLIQRNASIRSDFLNDPLRIKSIRKNFDFDEKCLLEQLVKREIKTSSSTSESIIKSLTTLIHIIAVGLEVPHINLNFDSSCDAVLDECVEMITEYIYKKSKS